MEELQRSLTQPQAVVVEAVEDYLKSTNSDIGSALINGFIDKLANMGFGSLDSIFGALGQAFTDLIGPVTLPQQVATPQIRRAHVSRLEMKKC